MVRQFTAEAGIQDKLYLRVRVVPGGCQGYLHKLDLDPKVTAEDYIFETDGITVVVFQRQAEMLRGSRVDYVEKEDQRGFTVDNLNFAGDWTGKWLSLLQQEQDVK